MKYNVYGNEIVFLYDLLIISRKDGYWAERYHNDFKIKWMASDYQMNCELINPRIISFCDKILENKIFI